MPIETYAVLARETYGLEDKNLTHSLPEGWNIKKVNVFNGVWGNCYAIFVNEEKRKIVLSIIGVLITYLMLLLMLD